MVSRPPLAHDAAGAGEPVVLIHGFTLDRRAWRPVAPVLAREHRVVACDLRGHGASPAPREDEPYSHAEDVLALAAALELDRPAFVGHSMGGAVALEVALARPEAVSRLVLVGALVPGRRLTPEVRDPIREPYRVAREHGVAAARPVWSSHPFFAGARPEVADMIGDYSGWHWRHNDPEVRLSPPVAERLEDVAVPTLVVVGERDVDDFRAMSEELAARIPGAELAVLPGAGHVAQLDAADAFLGAVLPFLAGQRRAPTSSTPRR